MIKDVKIINIYSHSDTRGYFREIFKLNKDFKNLKIGQISHSLVNQGVVKGWHGHLYQHQWNYVISGSIKVALLDNRKKSKTYNEIMEFIIDKENPIGYFFPPGILHGYVCLKGPMHIIYATSGTYDLSDEIRKPIKNYNF